MPRQMYSKFMFLFFIRYARNRIDHWCTVEQGNPNPRVHCSSGKLGKASFPTGTVDPRVGISLSPLNTNDGFSLSAYFTCFNKAYLVNLFEITKVGQWEDKNETSTFFKTLVKMDKLCRRHKSKWLT